MEKTALIVDDDRTTRRMITMALQGSIELQTVEAEDGKDALRILEKDTDKNISLVILDLNMPVMNGFEALQVISKDRPALPIIILTGDTDTEVTVKAMQLGAVDFLSKPVEKSRLTVSARNALKLSFMSEELSRLRRRNGESLLFRDLIGHDSGLQDSVATGVKAAACNLPVLITGETGTGKELFARAIHAESERAKHNFIAVNCGAIPEKLVESTLFGHVKGAFTGATCKAAGKFQEAHGGTIFLDEIGELPLEAQVKLLRVLQQGEVEPVGADKPVPVNVRLISATNRNLPAEVREGRFREDLYFRLNVLQIELPPLRARRNDIPLIAAHFVHNFSATHQMPVKNLSKAGLQKLQAHEWPGNVRELENVINRAMTLGESDVLQPDDLSLHCGFAKETGKITDNVIHTLNAAGEFKSLQELEQEIVAMALKHHSGNITQTARVLGVAKSTLYSKMENLAGGRAT